MTQTQDEGAIIDEDGKLFIGGLSWETSQEKLQEYFGQYGEVVDVVVMKNKETGRSRGFGFVTFKDSKCVAKVLSISPHELDGRTIDPKVCSSRGAQKGKKNGSFPKVFLGGLPPNCTETDIRSFFSRYGTVIEVVLMYDQEKKKARGFGFLSFETEDSVKQVCAEHYVKINGKQVECKHAEPRDKNSRQQQPQQNQWGSPNMGPGWGPPPPGGPGPMGPGGPSMGPGGPMPGPMGGPYQGGWGGPQQPGPYGPQGGWGPQPQGYGPGYQNWGGPGWGGAPQYGQGYGGYGPGYGGGGYGAYNGPPPSGGPPGGQPPAGDGYSNQTPAVGPGGPPAGQGPPGTYPQENSNYGPSRGYGSGGTSGGGSSSTGGGYSNNNGPQNYGPTGNYNNSGGYGTQGSYSASGDSNPPAASNRTGGQGQGYHPYRR